jgi:hypothetical protein
MQFGIFSVSDITRDPVSGETPSEAERIDAIGQIAQKAEEVGLDVFAIGEHHNPPFFSSAPTTLLAFIASTPVYKAGPSGLFTSFIDILDDDLIIARPVVLAATAGTARHALAVDDQMRPMFAYLRALTIPTSLFAAPEDWGDPALNKRIDRAAVELVLLMESGFAQKIRDASWESYQHEYGSAGGTETDIDLDTDMMRLAAGGSSASAAAPRRLY